jgi:hypothetical protein
MARHVHDMYNTIFLIVHNVAECLPRQKTHLPIRFAADKAALCFVLRNPTSVSVF